LAGGSRDSPSSIGGCETSQRRALYTPGETVACEARRFAMSKNRTLRLLRLRYRRLKLSPSLARVSASTRHAALNRIELAAYENTCAFLPRGCRPRGCRMCLAAHDRAAAGRGARSFSLGVQVRPGPPA